MTTEYKPRVPNRVRASFLAERYSLGLNTIYRRIREGSIKAIATRINAKGEPTGWQIERSEVKRLDAQGGAIRNYSALEQ